MKLAPTPRSSLFQSTLRSVERSDPLPPTTVRSTSSFQSTLRSVERSDLHPLLLRRRLLVSIHAPLGGAERPTLLPCPKPTPSFNPRSARWSGATTITESADGKHIVSIHAPLGGAERPRTPISSPGMACFNPRSARWSGATDQIPNALWAPVFQSTLRSVERSDPHGPRPFDPPGVSIHAPLGGAERPTHEQLAALTWVFQSTLRSVERSDESPHTNTRSDNVSIHAPLGGAERPAAATAINA